MSPLQCLKNDRRVFPRPQPRTHHRRTKSSSGPKAQRWTPSQAFRRRRRCRARHVSRSHDPVRWQNGLGSGGRVSIGTFQRPVQMPRRQLIPYCPKNPYLPIIDECLKRPWAVCGVFGFRRVLIDQSGGHGLHPVKARLHGHLRKLILSNPRGPHRRGYFHRDLTHV